MDAIVLQAFRPARPERPQELGVVWADAEMAELIALASDGSRPARDEIARRLRQPAYVFALQLLGRPEDALDVAQEAMLRFFASIERFDRSRPVHPWLRRIVRNLVIDLVRRRRVRAAESLDTGGPEGSAIDIGDSSVDIESSAEQRQLQELVWACVQGLRPAQREIIVLRDYQDLSYDEIAELLEIPIGTVMSRLHRARKVLAAAVRCRRRGGAKR